MPNLDRTGPEGKGPGTGRGRGKCFNLKDFKERKKKKDGEKVDDTEYGIGRGGKPRHLQRRNRPGNRPINND